jgi:hypothetical protein
VLLVDELSVGLAPVVVDRLLDAVRAAASQDGTAVLLVERMRSITEPGCAVREPASRLRGLSRDRGGALDGDRQLVQRPLRPVSPRPAQRPGHGAAAAAHYGAARAAVFPARLASSPVTRRVLSSRDSFPGARSLLAISRTRRAALERLCCCGCLEPRALIFDGVEDLPGCLADGEDTACGQGDAADHGVVPQAGWAAQGSPKTPHPLTYSWSGHGAWPRSAGRSDSWADRLVTALLDMDVPPLRGSGLACAGFQGVVMVVIAIV